MQDLGQTMAEFLVNVATAKLAPGEDTVQGDCEPKMIKKIVEGASINISFGSLGYTHFLAQLCDRVRRSILRVCSDDVSYIDWELLLVEPFGMRKCIDISIVETSLACYPLRSARSCKIHWWLLSLDWCTCH